MKNRFMAKGGVFFMEWSVVKRFCPGKTVFCLFCNSENCKTNIKKKPSLALQALINAVAFREDAPKNDVRASA